jgi:calcium/calmodulin-dependent protein kinase-4/calcium/calmodulin-dependent protein kinase I
VVAALPTKPIQREYELQGVVGEGGFGCVHAAWHRATNTRVALKRVFKASTTRAKFLQEVAILRHVCRPSDSENASGSGASGVLQLHDAFETADAYVLVTELVPGGELFDAVVETGALTESCASTLTRDVAATLAFLHAKRVVHGDVKPENILLSDRGSSTRLIDFGQAFRDDMNNRNNDKEETFTVGTTAYAAPEVLSRGDASAAADAWALGVVLYIMLCGRHPFDETNDASDEEMAARIRVGAFACESTHWQQLSAPARDLVQRLLTVDPRVRLTAEQVLQHEWIVSTSSASRQAMEA